jgi:hypothetical protein
MPDCARPRRRLVIVIENVRKAEDEHENDDEDDGFTWSSHRALNVCPEVIPSGPERGIVPRLIP